MLFRYLNPIRWISGFRNSLTGASVTLILIGIVSLNIVWGYPWLGILSACCSMFLVGWTFNRLSIPSTRLIASAPRCATAGEEVGVPIRLVNEGRWPGMDLVIEKTRKLRVLPVGGGWQFIQGLKFHRRGPQQLPPVLVESYFPFHLFRTHRWIDPDATIIVTPKRLQSDDDAHWRTLENTLKGIASRSAQGDQIHYIGSREYREGVPVRHWDFASWARLGKPILREFSSPASRSVRIVVDNVRSKPSNPMLPSQNHDRLEDIRLKILERFASRRSQSEALDPTFERILCLAASSVETLVRNGAAVVLQFVHEPEHPGMNHRDRQRVYRCEAGMDPSELLIALGKAKSYSRDHETITATTFNELQHDQQQERDEARIVLSCRDRSELDESDPLSMLANESQWVTDRRVESPNSDRQTNESLDKRSPDPKSPVHS